MAGYQPTGEDALLSIKPALRSIVLRSIPTALVCALLAIAAQWGLPALNASAWRDDALLVLVAVVVLRVLWECAVWASRRYILTAQRLISISGVFRRQVRDLPIGRVQNAVLDRTLAERIFALGTIGVASAGSAWIDVAWVMIARSAERLQILRHAIGSPRSDGMTGPGDSGLSAPKASAEDAREPASQPARPLAIGIAGGIGSGKSGLARALADLDCVVIDSDALAKDVLEEPDVKDQLRAWWGDAIIDEQGRVDRSRVASIVFEDDAQRKRLEALIHPRVKNARARIIAEHPDARAIVIDAPLLFEAGVDEECDAVLFVDVPRDIRLERVRDTRGWDEGELARREAGQWPVDRKRDASDLVIDNTGSKEDLARKAAEALASLENRQGREKHKNPAT